MIVRPYRETDRAAACALWVAAWQRTMPQIDFAARRGWIADLLDRRHETRSTALVAETAEGAVTGFAVVEPERQWLEQLAVDPAREGTGTGTALLDAAKALCGARLGLRVNQDNPRAVRFYQRAGFRIVAAGVNTGGQLKTWDMLWTDAQC